LLLLLGCGFRVKGIDRETIHERREEFEICADGLRRESGDVWGDEDVEVGDEVDAGFDGEGLDNVGDGCA
jgi:hypothetical protein